MSAGYWELAVLAPEEVAEALTNFLWELGALGVVEEQVAGGAPTLRAFFPAHSEASALAARVRTYADGLRALGFEAPDAPTVTALADADWGEAWRAHFRPLPIGTRFLVVPPWESAAREAGRLTLVIEPARAFGTGHHATTAGCLVQLEKIVASEAPASAIDLGTGSGILAIAAACLGVARVLAVDEDPDAVSAARANAALNGVAGCISCRVADAAVVTGEPAPLVLANLLSAAHLRLAPSYARQVAPDGRVVLGGLLDAEAPTVAAELGHHGFDGADVTSIDGWTTLALRRRR
jgi:ribosomal protein L11 methyltransferase